MRSCVKAVAVLLQQTKKVSTSSSKDPQHSAGGPSKEFISTTYVCNILLERLTLANNNEALV